MKNKLFKLYTKHQKDFKNLLSQFPGEDLAGPFLMSPGPAFEKSKRKLLVIGQETNNWTYHVDDLAQQMKVYEDFNLGENYRSSPFFNITSKLESALGNPERSYAWTNLSKFDHNSGRSQGEFKDAIANLDSILLSEIAICKPDVSMFYTGPAFDSRLKDIFNGIRFIPIPGFELNQFCKLEHPKLPKHSYRSYHPKSLRMNRLENAFIEFMEKI